MQGMDRGARHASLRGKGHGNYEGKMELESAGSWELDLTATNALMTGRERLNIEVGAAQGSAETQEQNDDD